MRLHAENPELSYEEVMDLAMRTGGRKFAENEPRYLYECRQCEQPVWLDQESHNRYDTNLTSGVGFTSPKCGDCWA